MKSGGKGAHLRTPYKRSGAAAGRGVHAKAVARLNHEVRREGPMGDWGGGKAANAIKAGATYRDPALHKPKTPGC